ncbi:hypothetical protein [Treponema primitia]|uniref:hypothetical protein n=1 Tax=Treponema primitia TaxID=88058 RepID=UPI0002555517|nr:hypothetical protein [Treponema primitia]
MQIQDPQIIRLIERLGEHYRSNIANRFIRPALLQLAIDNQTWSLIEVFMERGDQFRYQGYELDDLYRQLAAAADLVFEARTNLIPGIRSRQSIGAMTGPDKVLRDMAVNNFASNLRLLADLLNELFVLLVEADKAQARGHKPLYAQMPEVTDLGKRLIE